MGTRYLAATVWGCPPCALDAVQRLRRRLDAATWGWAQARWLLPLCGHPDAAVRAATLQAFHWAATRLARPTLRERLSYHLPVFRTCVGDRSPRVRAAAVALLGLLQDRTSHRLLSSALADPRPVVRRQAVRAVARAITLVPGARFTWAVCARLADPSPAVRAATLAAAGRTPGACPLPTLAGLLTDRARVRLRLVTVDHGEVGLQVAGGEVRHAAWHALPAALRPTASGLPWDHRIADARDVLARAGLLAPLAGGSRWALRPRPPTAPRPAPPLAAGSARRLRRWLAAPAPAKGPLGGQQHGVSDAARTRIGRLLGRLTPALRRRALRECGRLPLAGPRWEAVVGLLAHPQARTRYLALGALRRATVDDHKRPVLERALWLARRDPHPLVRRRALGLLFRWHAGAAVRRRALAALRDPHPVVRLAAVAATDALDVKGAPARWLARLDAEVPLVRAALLYRLIRRASGSQGLATVPPVETVIRALDQPEPVAPVVRLGAGRRTVDPGFASVRSAVVMALEAVYGTRHRGNEAQRARRWQDRLRARGWDL